MQTTSMQILKNNKYKNLKGGFNMFKTMNKRIKNEKGLTLIELLAVIVILAIVAAIAVPAIGNIINNSEIKAAKADVVNVLNAANIYFTDTGAADGEKVTDDQLDDYVQSWGVLKDKGFTITKGNPNTFSLDDGVTISAGGETISISGATIDNIQVDNADEVATYFDFAAE